LRADMGRVTRSALMLGYSFVVALVLVAASPYWLIRMLTNGRYRAGLLGRLGRVPLDVQTAIAGKRVIWLHAVSVGEVLAASRLVHELGQALNSPNAQMEGEWIIVVSTTTATGQALARKRFAAGAGSGGSPSGGAVPVFWYPLDLGWGVRAYLRALRPRLLILMESELWPRMLFECRRAAIPVAVVNARVSDRSFARGLKFRWVWERLLRTVRLFLAQSDEDARRLAAMGALPQTVRQTGNLKYDVRAPSQSRIAQAVTEAAAGRKVIVAGSTVDGSPASEESLFLRECMAAVWREYPSTLLVLAPRHPDRFDEVFRLAAAVAPTIRVTEWLRRPRGALAENVLLLDTIGDLASIYAIADVAFVGGSLVARGGHNPLEPAQFGVPVVMGSSYENFREIVTRMLEAGAILIGADGPECRDHLLAVLRDPDRGRVVGERGNRIFEREQGATERAVSGLMELLRASGSLEER
jgi:3-deoxy-D-manno-octulosonic-acid transferase